jgi:hypothetical protein
VVSVQGILEDMDLPVQSCAEEEEDAKEGATALLEKDMKEEMIVGMFYSSSKVFHCFRFKQRNIICLVLQARNDTSLNAPAMNLDRW